MEKKYLVIANKGLECEEIYYCGDIEVDAYKRFKEVKHKNKQIVLANIKYTVLHGFQLIESYEVINRVR